MINYDRWEANRPRGADGELLPWWLIDGPYAEDVKVIAESISKYDDPAWNGFTPPQWYVSLPECQKTLGGWAFDDMD